MIPLKNTYLFFFTFTLLGWVPADAQDLENLSKENLFKINGGIRMNHNFYAAEGIEYRRDPYQYVFSANLNLHFFLWEMPMSFTYTNKKGKLQHSLNQLSLRPTYKWLTLHLGKSTMNFSPYTLNGRLFDGVGVDIKPKGRFEGSAFYGRLQKEQVEDTTGTIAIEPAFRRMAWGLKGCYKPENGSIEVSILHSSDDLASLPVEMQYPLIAEKNTVAGLKASQHILQFIKIKGEIARSQFSFGLPSSIHSENNGVTIKDEQYLAFNGAVDYEHEHFTIGLGYERVDPGYRTHGAYYFNNDLENVTLNLSTWFFEKKMQISGSSGIQHDNLNESKMSKMKRLVGEVTISAQPSDNLSASLAYSNFSSYTSMWKSYEDYQMTQPYEDLDTLNFIQISQNVSGQAGINFGSSEIRQHQVSVFGNYQVSNNTHENETGMVSRLVNGSLMYVYSCIPLGLSFSPGFSGYGSTMAGLQSLTTGPVMTVTKVNKSKKWRTTLSFNYNHAYVGGVKQQSVGVCRLISRYTYKKKHRFSFIATEILKTKQDASGNTSEMTISLNYSYRF